MALAHVVQGGSNGLSNVFARFVGWAESRFYRGCGKPFILWKMDRRLVMLSIWEKLLVFEGFAIRPALA
jgi:hypothetical protein